jgi:uracil-DNA glycosylase family 4
MVVGMAPGYHEDEQGKSWVGWSGDKLGKFIRASGFPELVDVYLSNAVRCRVPTGQKPTKGELTKCRPYLLMDLQRLTDLYQEVIVLVCGADAAKGVAGVPSLGVGLRMQGVKEGIEGLSILTRHPTLFFTYHPAILYQGRKPQLVSTIQAHFMLLRRYLTGKFTPNDLQVVPELGAPLPDKIPGRVTCDIETYGIMKGYEQTVFTPPKSCHVDGIPFGRHIVIVSFAYREGPCRIRTPVYVFRDPAQKQLIRNWIKGVIGSRSILQGQNFKYDVLYLKANDPILNRMMVPGALTLDDTLIKAFLLDEAQPEKSLKELAVLYGIASYQGLRVTGREGRAVVSATDPDLLYYGCLDAAATLVLGEQLDERVRMRYGKDSAKLGKTCAQMRNL